LNVQLVAIKKRIENETNELSLLVDNLDAIDLASTKQRLNEIVSMKIEITRMRAHLDSERAKLKRQEKSALKLLEVPCGDQFPDCKYIKDSHEDKSNIIGQQKSIEDIEAIINTIDDGFTKNEEAKLNAIIDDYTFKQNKTSERKLLVSQIHRQEDAITRRLDEKSRALINAKATLDDMNQRVTTVLDEMMCIKEIIIGLEKEINELDDDRIKMATRLGTLDSKMKQLITDRDCYAKIRTQWRLYEGLIAASSKKGIPSKIIQSQLPVINAEIEKILQGVVDFTLQIEKDPDSSATDIYIDYGDSRRLIETASGMEKMISSLAIRVALLNASTLPKPDFLMIDEGFGTLDETNVEACSRLLVSLKRWFRSIIVISHIDGIKDIADHMIDITRNGKDSFVNV